MKTTRILSVLFCLFAVAPFTFAEDDEARQQSGLPTYIGNRPGSSPVFGADATVSGSFVVQGMADDANAPSFTVAVLANGAVVGRQRVNNKGGFSFTNVPRVGISIIAEADGLEIASLQVGALNPPPLSNRHDVIVTWGIIGNRIKQRNEVISVRNSHKRTEENQKLLEKAIAAAKEKKTDAAAKLFDQLLQADPADFVAWTELGNLNFLSEKYTDAEKNYNKALGLKADFAPAMLNLGKLFLAEKKFDQSIEILSKAVVQTPDSPDVNHFLGEAYLQAKKGSKAVGYLNKAIELAPIEKAEIHVRLAALYNAANLKDRAVAEYKLLLSKMPNHPEKASIEKYIKDNSSK